MRQDNSGAEMDSGEAPRGKFADLKFSPRE
jgi:hypothetical protein